MDRRQAERVALQSAMPDIVWHAFKGPVNDNDYDCFHDPEVIDALLGVPEEAWFDEDEEEGAVGEQEEQ